MLFNTWGYIFIYLFLAIPLYWMIPAKYRNLFIVALSVAFYSLWRWEFTFLMIFSATVDYFCAQKIQATENVSKRKYWLALALVTNLSLLVFFKYTYFIYDNIRLVGEFFSFKFPSLESQGIRILLPLGISFYTFETISYTIDVYRRIYKPTRNFTEYLTFITFWPKLIAGPILRPHEIMPQLRKAAVFNYARAYEGIELIIFGLAKKILLADILGSRVDYGFELAAVKLSAFDVWVLAFMFGFQIYYDFSAYSDIAIGTSKLLGFDLPDNFNWPYKSTSPRDFWKRWHISLSSWIRDYLYLPLTNQKFQVGVHKHLGDSVAKTRALFLTWFIMGLWHGAGWNFVVWGLYHALLVYLFRKSKIWQSLEKNYPTLGWLSMLPLSMLGWIFFRAKSMEQVTVMMHTILTPWKYAISERCLQHYSYPIATGLVVLTIAANFYKDRAEKKPVCEKTLQVIRLLLIPVLVCCIIVSMKQVRQFIYFQF